jgi:hypothetical protein
VSSDIRRKSAKKPSKEAPRANEDAAARFGVARFKERSRRGLAETSTKHETAQIGHEATSTAGLKRDTAVKLQKFLAGQSADVVTH